MSSITIFFNAVTTFKSELSPLKSTIERAILLVNSTIYEQLTEAHKGFFEKIHIIEPISFDTTLPWVTHYLAESSRDNLRLITNDEACTLLVGKLIDHLHLKGDGEQALVKFIDKILMKNILYAKGVHTPPYQAFNKEDYCKNKVLYREELEKKFHYPWVIKPIALYGSSGFKEIHNRTEWETYAEQIVHSKIPFQIEEFIDGTLFHCDAIIQNKEIRFISISEYLWPMAFFNDGYPTGSIVLPHSDSRWDALITAHEQIIAAIEPPDGATHCELFLTKNDEVVFLEIAARPSGALVVPLIDRMTGVNIELAHFNLKLQNPINIQPKPVTQFAFFCYFPKTNGTVLNIEVPRFNSELHIDWNIKPGEVIQLPAPEEGEIPIKPSNIAATLILSNANFDALYQDFLMLKSVQLITMQPANYSSS